MEVQRELQVLGEGAAAESVVNLKRRDHVHALSGLEI
jgi:hypothetical protein